MPASIGRCRGVRLPGRDLARKSLACKSLVWNFRQLRMTQIRDEGPAATFTIKVHPRARKNAITGKIGDVFKVSLTAPPADRKANHACIQLLANLLKVPRSSVTITSGQTNRTKVIRVVGVTAEQVRIRLTT